MPPAANSTNSSAHNKNRFDSSKLPINSTDEPKFEKDGQTEKAIACYEGCIQNGFDGTFPYERLAVIYRKLSRTADEVRVLKRAVAVYSTGAASVQGRSKDKLLKFQERLRTVLGQV